MDSVGIRAAEMAQGFEHRPRYCDYFIQHTFIYRGRKKNLPQ